MMSDLVEKLKELIDWFVNLFIEFSGLVKAFSMGFKDKIYVDFTEPEEEE